MLPLRLKRPFFPLLVAALLATADAPSLFAQTTISWSSTSDTTFSTGANWINGVAPANSLTTNSANFDGASLVDPVVTASQSLQGLNFSNKTFTLSATNGAVLTLGAGGIRQNNLYSLTVNMDIVLGANQEWYSQSSSQSLTMNGNVSGAFSLSKNGGGTVLLNGTNTYTGTTTVTSSVLLFGKTSALYNGDTASWTAANLIVNSGTLAFRVGGTGEFTSGNVTTLLTNLSTTNNNGLKTGSMIGFDTTNASDGTFTIADVIANPTGSTSGTVGVNKLGSGTLVLTGANTYTGRTTISAGTLSVSSIGNRSVTSSLGAPTTLANGTISIGSGTTDATLLYTGATASTNRVINLAGSTGGATLDSSGSGPLTFTSNFTAAAGGSKTLTLTGTATGNTIAAAIVNNSVTNLTSVTKAGTGSWILSGTNTYTGATTVSAGTLLVNGSLAASSAVTVSSGGTLGGSGTINGATSVSSGGTLAPGNSPGLLTFGSNLTLASGSNSVFEINGTTRGTTFDAVNVSGLTTYGGTFTLTFGSTIADATTLNLLALTGGSTGGLNYVTATGSYAGSFTNSSGVWTLTSGSQSLTFTESTGNLAFAASAIPEPSTYAALAGLAVLALAAHRRRRV